MINKLKAYIKEKITLENQLFSDNEDAVAESNRKTIRVIFAIALICYTMCFILSLVVEVYAPLRFLYLGALAAVITAILIYKFIHIKNPAVYSTMIYGFIVIYAACSGAFVTPKYIGVIILICLFEFPVFILSRKKYVILFEFVFAAVYLMIVIPHKWDFIVIDEVVNTMLFATIGIMTGIYIQNVRLNNLELIRKRSIDRIVDETTGLLNRRSLYEYFAQYGENKLTPFAIAMLDIDWFKAYNDTYGHLAGDRCLMKLGAYFREFGEQRGITFYRYGGEEFLAVLLNKPSEEVPELLKALREGVYSMKIESKNSSFGYVTISVGATYVLSGTEEINPEVVIDRADQALYKAKNGGRNRVVMFESEEC